MFLSVILARMENINLSIIRARNYCLLKFDLLVDRNSRPSVEYAGSGSSSSSAFPSLRTPSGNVHIRSGTAVAFPEEGRQTEGRRGSWCADSAPTVRADTAGIVPVVAPGDQGRQLPGMCAERRAGDQVPTVNSQNLKSQKSFSGTLLSLFFLTIYIF